MAESGTNYFYINDLRLTPRNRDFLRKILDISKDFSKILIVDETRRTGSVSEELMTLFVENLDSLPKIKRLTAEDCFGTLGPSAKQLLPSKKGIVEMVLGMVG